VAGHLHTLGEHVDLGLVVRHREKDARSTGDALLDSAVSHERFQFSSIGIGKANPTRRSASHRTRS